MRGQNSGFTFVELLVVISIVSILTAIAVSSFFNLQKNSRDARRQSDLKIVQSALEHYHADQTYYPVSIDLDPSSGWNLAEIQALTSSTGRPTPFPTPVRTYLNQPPKEPKSPDTAPYIYQGLPATGSACDNEATACVKYCLYANLENTPAITNPACPDRTGYNYKLSPP